MRNTGDDGPEKKDTRFHRYLHYTESLIKNYKHDTPFHIYLRKYFAENRKHGSRDRKILTSLCYYFFRPGHGVKEQMDVSRRILLATFLIETKPTEFLGNLAPSWNQNTTLSLPEKLEMVAELFSAENIVPFSSELGGQVSRREYNLSFLKQPRLFIRIRPGKRGAVFAKLKNADISYEHISENCLAFINTEKISGILDIDREAVIQDVNSQRTLNVLQRFFAGKKFSAWDCCAASGGKSILAKDLFPGVELTVSDSRRSILENLKKRFKTAGVVNYRSFVSDLSEKLAHSLGNFDLVIADVPCTGSGTWSRTPEQLYFFSVKDIEKYAHLQRQIVTNVVSSLKSDGLLLYITCSVFSKENEENVSFFQTELPFSLIETKYLIGMQENGDTLFYSLLQKK